MLELVKDRDAISGDGSKKEFDFDFYTQKDTDLEVYIVDRVAKTKTKQTLTTDYSVKNISEDPLGFTVAFNSTVLTNDQDAFAIRKMPFTQLLNLGVVTDYDERKITNALDKLTALIQQVANDVMRTIKFNDESSSVNKTIAEPNAGKCLKWDESGNLVNSEYNPDEVANTCVNERVAAESARDAAESEALNAANSALTAASFAEQAATFNPDSYAKKEGDETQVFKVADGVDPGDGVNKKQLDLKQDISTNIPRNDISGLTISNDVSNTTRNIRIDVGVCADSTNTTKIVLNTPIIKGITDVWSAGSYQYGRPSNVPLSAYTPYHVFIIAKEDGTVDAGFDTNINATNLLAASGFTKYRRVGSVRTDVNGNIEQFNITKMGNGAVYVELVGLVNNYSATGTTVEQDLYISVPAGINVMAHLFISAQCTSANAYPITAIKSKKSGSTVLQAVSDDMGVNTVTGFVPVYGDGKVIVHIEGATTSRTHQVNTLGYIDSREG